jgi:hypothetical protein
VRDPVGLRVGARRSHRLGLHVDRQRARRAEPGGDDREDPAPAADVEHGRARSDRPLEEGQRDPCGLVRSGAEGPTGVERHDQVSGVGGIGGIGGIGGVSGIAGDPGRVDDDAAPGADGCGPGAPRIEVAVVVDVEDVRGPRRGDVVGAGHVGREAHPTAPQIDLEHRGRAGLPQRIGGQLRLLRGRVDLHHPASSTHPGSVGASRDLTTAFAGAVLEV